MTKSKLSRLAVIGIAGWLVVVVAYLFYADHFHYVDGFYVIAWTICGSALIALSTIGLGWALNLER
jgi:hypothetical protein